MAARDFQRQLEESGLVNDNGLLERPLPLVPPGNIHPVVQLIEVSDEFRLEWHWSGNLSREKRGQETNKQRLLDAFIKLDDAPPEAYLRFARKYGVLLLCEHGAPASHNPGSIHKPGCSPTRSEPLSNWRHFVRHIKATLAIATSLHRGMIGADEDWITIF